MQISHRRHAPPRRACLRAVHHGHRLHHASIMAKDCLRKKPRRATCPPSALTSSCSLLHDRPCPLWTPPVSIACQHYPAPRPSLHRLSVTRRAALCRLASGSTSPSINTCRAALCRLAAAAATVLLGQLQSRCMLPYAQGPPPSASVTRRAALCRPALDALPRPAPPACLTRRGERRAFDKRRVSCRSLATPAAGRDQPRYITSGGT